MHALIDIHYYYPDHRYGGTAETPFVIRRTLRLDQPLEPQARATLERERPGAILVRIDNKDGLCERSGCRRPTGRDCYVKVGGIWQHLCERCYAEELREQPTAYTLWRAWDHALDMLAGREP